MKKIFFPVLFFLSALSLNAQIYSSPNSGLYGVQYNRLKVPTALLLPTTCGAPTVKSVDSTMAMIGYDSCNHHVWFWDPASKSWSSGGSGGGGISTELDPVWLAAKPNYYTKAQDDSVNALLSTAFTAATFDTTTRVLTLTKRSGGTVTVTIPRGGGGGSSGIVSLSSSKATNMVTVSGDNGSNTTFSINSSDSLTKIHTTDTATMLNSYKVGLIALNADTATIQPRLNNITASIPSITGKLNILDTTSMLNNYKVGITILNNDTATIQPRLNNIIASIPSITGKVNISDTAAMMNSSRLGIIALNADTLTIQPRLNNIISSIPSITGKVNISDTAAMLLSHKIGIIALNADTATIQPRLNNIIGSIPSITGKVNISDTGTMLNPYKNAYYSITQSTDSSYFVIKNLSGSQVDTVRLVQIGGSTGGGGSTSSIDTTALLAGYKTFYPRSAISLVVSGSSGASTYNPATGVLTIPNYVGGGGGNMNYSDTAAMLNVYRLALIALSADTATIQTRLNNVLAVANSKIADTSALHTNITALTTTVASHTSLLTSLVSDTTTIAPRFTNVINLANLKVNIADTTGKWIGIGFLPSLMRKSDTSLLNLAARFALAGSGGGIASIDTVTTYSSKYFTLLSRDSVQRNLDSSLARLPFLYAPYGSGGSSFDTTQLNLASRFANIAGSDNLKLKITDSTGKFIGIGWLPNLMAKSDTSTLNLSTRLTNINGAISSKFAITDTSGKWIGIGFLPSLMRKADTTGLNLSTRFANVSGSIPSQFNPIAGTNVTISGTYPNITFNSTASGGSSFDSTTLNLATRFSNIAGSDNLKLKITDSTSKWIGVGWLPALFAKSDTSTLNLATRFSNVASALGTKISDTSALHTNVAALTTTVAGNVTSIASLVTDSATIAPRLTNIVNSITSKLNITDTASKWVGVGFLPSIMRKTDTTGLNLSTRFSNVAGAIPSLTAGTNVTITGTFPALTINSSGGGGGSLDTANVYSTVFKRNAARDSVQRNLDSALMMLPYLYEPLGSEGSTFDTTTLNLATRFLNVSNSLATKISDTSALHTNVAANTVTIASNTSTIASLVSDTATIQPRISNVVNSITNKYNTTDTSSKWVGIGFLPSLMRKSDTSTLNLGTRFTNVVNATPVLTAGTNVTFGGTFPNITINASGSGGGTTTNSLTMNNSGTGAASGTTFNGSAAQTISYNTIGAAPTIGSSSITTLGTISTGIWNGTKILTAYGDTGKLATQFMTTGYGQKLRDSLLALITVSGGLSLSNSITGYGTKITGTNALDTSAFYYTGNSVGLGTALPNAPFHIAKVFPSAGTGYGISLLIRPSNHTMNGNIIFNSNGSSNAAMWGEDNLGTGGMTYSYSNNYDSTKPGAATWGQYFGISSSGQIFSVALTASKVVVTDASKNLVTPTKLTIAMANGDTGRLATQWSTAGMVKKYVDSSANGGTWTPTLTGTTNLGTPTLTQASYHKVDNIVWVSVGFTVTPTAATTNSVMTITLPINTATASQNYIGNGEIFGGGASSSAAAGLVSLASTSTATVTFQSTTTTASNGNIVFSYKL